MCSASRAIGAARSAGFASTGGRWEFSTSARACWYSVTLVGNISVTHRAVLAPESGAIRSSSSLNTILCINHAFGAPFPVEGQLPSRTHSVRLLHRQQHRWR